MAHSHPGVGSGNAVVTGGLCVAWQSLHRHCSLRITLQSNLDLHDCLNTSVSAAWRLCILVPVNSTLCLDPLVTCTAPAARCSADLTGQKTTPGAVDESTVEMCAVCWPAAAASDSGITVSVLITSTCCLIPWCLQHSDCIRLAQMQHLPACVSAPCVYLSCALPCSLIS